MKERNLLDAVKKLLPLAEDQQEFLRHLSQVDPEDNAEAYDDCRLAISYAHEALAAHGARGTGNASIACKETLSKPDGVNKAFRDQGRKHTPTPWKASRVVRKSNYGNFTVHVTGAIDDPIRKGEKYHETVCKVSGGVHDKPEVAEANATFIIHAVNCHENLVNALETARLQLGEYTDGEGAAKLHTLAVIDRALVKAKETPTFA